MSNDCKRPTVYGRIPFSADPFGLMLGQQVHARPRLRYEGEGGSGAGAGGGGAGASGGEGGEGGDGGDDPKLGDAGQRALEAERQKRADARKERDAARTELEAFTKLGLTPEQIAELVDKNDPNNPERIRKQAERDATKATEARMSNTLRLGAIRAAATAGGFVDVDAVIALTPADKIAELGVDLEAATVDTAAVAKLLDDLATSKPYLKGTPAPAPTAAQAGIGAGGTAGTSAEPSPGLGRLRQAYAPQSR